MLIVTAQQVGAVRIVGSGRYLRFLSSKNGPEGSRDLCGGEMQPPEVIGCYK